MASIQDLLAAAARPRKSPFVGLLEGVAAGFGRAQAAAPEQTRLLMLMDRERAAAEQDRADRERAAEAEKRLLAAVGEQREQGTQAGLKAAGPASTPAHPAMRLAGAVTGKHGYLEPKFEVVEPPSYQAKEYADADGRSRLGRFNPQSGLIEQSPNDPFAPVARNSETDPVKRAKDLRGEFTDLSKDFFKVNEAVARLRGSAKDPSAAGDLALIFNYMKILDPGSVVREGEFATAENAAGIPERLRAQYNKAVNGEKLADDQRADFVDRGERLFEEQRLIHGRRIKEYERLAMAVGADPKQVIFDPVIEARKAPAAADVEHAAAPDAIHLTGTEAKRLEVLRAKAAAGRLK